MLRIATMVIGAGVLVAGVEAEGPTKKDHNAIQGTWKVVDLINHQGEKATNSELKEMNALLIFSGNKWESQATLDGRRVVKKGVFKLDPTKNPKAIDFYHKKEKIAQPGIYLLEGNVLKICVPSGVPKKEEEPLRQRPTKLAGGKKTVFIVHKRQK